MRSPAVFSFSQALVDLAQEKGLLGEIQNASQQLSLYLKLPELVQFLNHPKVPAQGKKEMLMRLTPPDSPKEFRNFLNLIIDRHREELLPAMIEEVVNLTLKVQGYQVVDLVSAQVLSEEEQAVILRDLEKSWGAKVFIRYRENPALIGGVIIRRDDQLYDGSLAGQLKALKQWLLENNQLPV